MDWEKPGTGGRGFFFGIGVRWDPRSPNSLRELSELHPFGVPGMQFFIRFFPVFPLLGPPLQLHLLFPRLFQFLFHLHIHEKIKFCQIIRSFLASEGALEWRGGLQANPAPFHPSLELPGFFGILEFSWRSRLGGVGFSLGSTGLDGNNREWGRSPVVAPGIRAAPAWDF